MTDNYSYFLATGKSKEVAIKLHHERYIDLGFFTKNEVDPYESMSTYFAVSEGHPSNNIVGVSRLISAPSVMGLPTIKNFDVKSNVVDHLLGLDQSSVVEYSAFTKLPNHNVGIGLIVECFRYSMDNNCGHWLCCLDDRVYNYLHRVFKVPFDVIGTPKVYLGSNTIPCYIDLYTYQESVKDVNKRIYDLFWNKQEVSL